MLSWVISLTLHLLLMLPLLLIQHKKTWPNHLQFEFMNVKIVENQADYKENNHVVINNKNNLIHTVNADIAKENVTKEGAIAQESVHEVKNDQNSNFKHIAESTQRPIELSDKVIAKKTTQVQNHNKNNHKNNQVIKTINNPKLTAQDKSKIDDFINGVASSTSSGAATGTNTTPQHPAFGAIMGLIQTIKPCWVLINTPQTRNINVRVKVKLDEQGYVKTKELLDSKSDQAYQKVAASALHALSDKRCQPFKLPLADYHMWKEMILNFSPGQMIG